MNKRLLILSLFLITVFFHMGLAQQPELLLDIKTGSEGSSLRNLTNVNGVLFFSADDGVHGAELWKSDGTPEGTVLVKDINPGSNGSSPDALANVNGTLYFKATGP